MKDFFEDAWGFIKEWWIMSVLFILFMAFIGGLLYADGTGAKIILERHGYQGLNWFQASMIDVEELCGDKDMDVDVKVTPNYR